MRLLLICLLSAVALAAPREEAFFAKCQRPGTRADLFTEMDWKNPVALIQRDGLEPTLIDAHLSRDGKGPLVHFDRAWGVPDMEQPDCRRDIPDNGTPTILHLNPCLYFLSNPALALSHSIAELVAEHEAIPLKAHVICRVNGSTEPGAPLCSKITILEHIISVDPGLVGKCSVGS